MVRAPLGLINGGQKQAECEVADGLGMLVEQAGLAFMIWFGGQVNAAPDTRSVISTIRNNLDQALEDD